MKQYTDTWCANRFSQSSSLTRSASCFQLHSITFDYVHVQLRSRSITLRSRSTFTEFVVVDYQEVVINYEDPSRASWYALMKNSIGFSCRDGIHSWDLRLAFSHPHIHSPHASSSLFPFFVFSPFVTTTLILSRFHIFPCLNFFILLSFIQ